MRPCLLLLDRLLDLEKRHDAVLQVRMVLDHLLELCRAHLAEVELVALLRVDVLTAVRTLSWDKISDAVANADGLQRVVRVSQHLAVQILLAGFALRVVHGVGRLVGLYENKVDSLVLFTLQRLLVAIQSPVVERGQGPVDIDDSNGRKIIGGQLAALDVVDGLLQGWFFGVRETLADSVLGVIDVSHVG